MSTKPRCPRCNRPGQPAGELWHCRACLMLFDNEPEEGGDYSDRNPAARLEREERKRESRFPKRK